MICKPGEVQRFENLSAQRHLGPTLDAVGGSVAGVLNALDDLETALIPVLAPTSPRPIEEAPYPPVDPPAIDTAWRLCLAASEAQSRINDIRSRLRL